MKRSFTTPLLLAATCHAGQILFEQRTLATDLKGGYQVLVTDLNQDRRPDLVALASGMKELFWFDNPEWGRHVLARGFQRMIHCAAVEQGGAVSSFVLAHEFANVAKNSLGVISLLEPDGDPRQPWKSREIDRLPTAHRLRGMQLRSGRVIVNAPLTHGEAEPPEYRGIVPLVFYRPPHWKRERISSTISGVLHGIFVTDWDGDGFDELLTASFEGIHLLRQQRSGHWRQQRLAPGDPTPWPKSGASEIVVARLGKQRFLATIEPWHGHQVCVYRQAGASWVRQVIDASEPDGHTLLAADLNGDGNDELIVGFRGPGRSVYYYEADRTGSGWQRHAIDRGGIAAAGCAVADFDADSRPDVACIGSATANLKLYRNLGAGAAAASSER
ncbi:MAG: VCBS repeat-containing protein [Bryobacteraceae bacterium]|nr:VCBS repeat-containing protein [Bryobacteraceae bacterium]MDW8378730.1 VCBS repeat-containing protein [Bryobacterales bacterium]